jgi:hypothetical protein
MADQQEPQALEFSDDEEMKAIEVFRGFQAIMERDQGEHSQVDADRILTV